MISNKPFSPSYLTFPCFLVNFPFTVDNKVPNNFLMTEYCDGTKYDYDRAFSQWMDLYNYIVSHNSLVYILPSEGNFQDLPYVANLGCILPHIQNRDVIILSNFTSLPRIGEDIVGRKFFSMMEYDVQQSPYKFEGEADLKWIRDNIYIAGYGIRTERETHDWLKETFGMDIISVLMNDEELYHFDCSFLPLSPTKALVATTVFCHEEIRAMEQILDIIPVPKKYLYYGWTNGLVMENKVLCAPYTIETGDEKSFRRLLSKHGFDLVVFNLSEFEKSGAALSCLVMHLNYRNRTA